MRNCSLVLQKYLAILVIFQNLFSYFLFLFVFPYVLVISPVFPSWIIAIVTCYTQSTQTYFLRCLLPAAWLRMAHPSSAAAPVFLLTTSESSGVHWNNQMPPPHLQVLSRLFLGRPSSMQPFLYCSLLLPAAHWLFLPGLEGPERGHCGLVCKCGYLLLHLYFLFAPESRDATDI